MFSWWLVLAAQTDTPSESIAEGVDASPILDAWASTPSGDSMISQVAMALFVVLVLIFAASWLLKRFSRFGGKNNSRAGLKVLESLPLGGKKMIHVVRIHARNLVIGVSGDRIELLTELPEDELPDEILTETEDRGQRFGNLLKFRKPVRDHAQTKVKSSGE